MFTPEGMYMWPQVDMATASSLYHVSENCMQGQLMGGGGWGAGEHLSISAIPAPVEAVWEGLLGGRVLLWGPPSLGGKCASTQLLSIFFQLLLGA